MPWFRTFPLCLVFLLSAPVSAEPITLHSGDRQISLLELYTSEGCSSCPPADRWMSSLKSDRRLWREVVPVAFHVDYWDYLGWKDRFASAAYGARQRAYAQYDLIRSVYTPGLILNGEEWRGWFLRPQLSLEANEAVGELTLEVNDRQAKGRFVNRRPLPETLQMHVAVLGFDLSTAVQRGENQGRTLTHDFVVLGYEMTPMIHSETGYRAQMKLPNLTDSSHRHAVAGWVSLTENPRPIQAVGGWL
ncbi:MAG: DUF1223 domain-containing protein [Gammaproteobacteria bacterium]|nr:DUF1223 domain-containing protein [Gammaproteobacteria bacterium]MCP5424078.1 DUF1223 domain-containing protein [Gammaproteobacteria bacterium]MCP5459473.1 DUF1223 domain-containing protein [Gammaproteobacteria bacterium]